jgi:hypothetical protein
VGLELDPQEVEDWETVVVEEVLGIVQSLPLMVLQTVEQVEEGLEVGVQVAVVLEDVYYDITGHNVVLVEQ